MEGVLRAEIAKGGGFKGVEALRLLAQTSLCQKFWPMVVGGSDPHIPPLGYAPDTIYLPWAFCGQCLQVIGSRVAWPALK